MDIRIHRAPASVKIAVSGELDMATSPYLDRAIREALTHDGIRAVVLDLAEVTFCDSSGVAVLDKGFGAAAQQGACLRIASLSRPVSRVLEIVGMLDALTRPTA